MKCGKCGYENSEGSKFCACCGEALETAASAKAAESANEAFTSNQAEGGESFQREGANQYNANNNQPYGGGYQNGYNGYNNFNNGFGSNFGMMPPSDYEKENGTAKALAVSAIVIGVVSTLFAVWSIFTGANYGAIAAFVLAIGAVVKAKPGCVKGAKTAAVIVAVIALAVSAVVSFSGNIAFLAEGSQDYYDDSHNDFFYDFYDDFYDEFGSGSEDDFSHFGVNADGGEIL